MKTILKRHRKTQPLDFARVCAVCSDKASHYNFGCITCESCKSFFRRVIIKPETLICVTGSKLCDVKIPNRRFCGCCRLQKCLDIGMKRTDFLLNDSLPRNSSTHSLTDIVLDSILCDQPLGDPLPSTSGAMYIDDQEELENQDFVSPTLINTIDTILKNHMLTINEPSTDNVRSNCLHLIPGQSLIDLGKLQESLDQCIVHHHLNSSQVSNSPILIIEDIINMGHHLLPGVIRFISRVPCYNKLSIDDKKTLIMLRLPAIITVSFLPLYVSSSRCFRFNTTDKEPVDINIMDILHRFNQTEGFKNISKVLHFHCNMKKILGDCPILMALFILLKLFEIPSWQESCVTPSLKSYCADTFSLFSFQFLVFFLYHKKDKDSKDFDAFTTLYRWNRQVADILCFKWIKSLEVNTSRLEPLMDEIFDFWKKEFHSIDL